jgi:hypothetical protein
MTEAHQSHIFRAEAASPTLGQRAPDGSQPLSTVSLSLRQRMRRPVCITHRQEKFSGPKHLARSAAELYSQRK